MNPTKRNNEITSDEERENNMILSHNLALTSLMAKDESIHCDIPLRNMRIRRK